MSYYSMRNQSLRVAAGDRARAGQVYKGWSLTFSNTRPVTGQWRAERHGVGLCHSSKEALIYMIDARDSETPR